MMSHVAAYYSNLMNAVDTGCPMMDYCRKDVYLCYVMENLK